MKLQALALALSLSAGLVSGIAHAADSDEQYVSCGEGRKKGPESAQVGLVNGLEASHVYLAGKELAADDFAVAGRDNAYIITIFGHGGGDRKFEIRQKPADAQEFSLPVKGAQQKVGSPLPCIWHEAAE